MSTAGLFLLFFKGILIGFVIALPVGPVGVLCIQRTLVGRYSLSLVTGLGAGVADTVYGAIAALSLVSITNFITSYNFYLRFLGGILVIGIGLSIFRAPFYDNFTRSKQQETLLQGFTSAFFLTLSNPIALLVFAAAFTVMGISPEEASLTQGFILVGGVFIGANLWWFSLCTTTLLIRHKVSKEHLLWINRISGVMLLGFGAYMLLSLV